MTAQLKNVGLTRVFIQQRGTGLRILINKLNPIVSSLRNVDWDHITTFDIFKDHEWTEPGEVIEEQMMLEMHNNEHDGFQLQLRIVSNKIYLKKCR